MEAARYGAEIGHKITLIEKTDTLGGHFIEATRPAFKTDHRHVLEWLEIQVKKSDVEILMNTEATPELMQNLKPDAVIVATGSKYISIPIPGIEHTITPDMALQRTAAIGQQVVVIGGGLVGAETALDLGIEGKNVTVLEMLSEIVIEDEPLSKISLTKHLESAGVKMLTSCKAISVGADYIIYENAEGEQKTLSADTVVCATGLKADETLSAPFEGCAVKVIKIGDARQAKKSLNVSIRHGRQSAKFRRGELNS